MNDDPTPGTQPESPADKQDKRFISCLRAAANVILLVFGLLFLLGFVVVLGLTGNMHPDSIRPVATAVSYMGFIAGVAFITSIISIIIENRTGENKTHAEDHE